MARKQFDLIVFDWDGTLMDSTSTIVRCIQAAARDLGLPIPDKSAASYVIGLGLQDAMQAAIPDVDPKYYPRIVERYRHHYLGQDKDLSLFDGVREMLDDLGQQGYFLAVATGKSRVGLNRALNSTKLLSAVALRRRDILQAASGHVAGAYPRTRPGNGPYADDRRHHPRSADGA